MCFILPIRGKDKIKGSGYAAVMHILGPCVGWTVVVPLVMWLLRKDDSEFIDFHGREAVRFNLFTVLYVFATFLVSLILTIIISIGVSGAIAMPAMVFGGIISLWLIFVTFYAVFYLVCVIMATVKASKSKLYCYPLVFSPRRKFLLHGSI